MNRTLLEKDFAAFEAFTHLFAMANNLRTWALLLENEGQRISIQRDIREHALHDTTIQRSLIRGYLAFRFNLQPTMRSSVLGRLVDTVRF